MKIVRSSARWRTMKPVKKKPDVEILTLIEVSKLLGVRTDALRHQIANGKLAAEKFGNQWSVERTEVERYRAEHLGKTGPVPDATRPRYANGRLKRT